MSLNGSGFTSKMSYAPVRILKSHTCKGGRAAQQQQLPKGAHVLQHGASDPQQGQRPQGGSSSSARDSGP